MSQGLVKIITQWEPKVRALVNWDKASAIRRAEQTGSGPMAGWSVGIKDIIDVAGLPTCYGSDFIPAQPAAKNATIVDLLLAKGAFVLAKTVTTVFAYVDAGPTRNPWNLQHTPGGSSSGSAAAVACGMTRLALGTQTIGSVIRPASFCGVVGFKPTYGLIPMDGVFPFSVSVDTVGFFTSNVSDAQTTFAAVMNEPVTSRPTAPLKIGLLTDVGCELAEAQMLNAVRGVAEQLTHAGHDVRSAVLPGLAVKAYDNHIILIASEAAQAHRDLFAKYGQHYPPKLRELVLSGQQVTEQQLQNVHSKRGQITEEFAKLVSEYDLLITPAAPGPAPEGIVSTGDYRMNLLATHTGMPALTLPCALSSDGLPLGVQLIGLRNNDQFLLAASSVIEEIISFGKHPRMPNDV